MLRFPKAVTHFSAGSYSSRPMQTTSLPNVFMAGDWVKGVPHGANGLSQVRLKAHHLPQAAPQIASHLILLMCVVPLSTTGFLGEEFMKLRALRTDSRGLCPGESICDGAASSKFCSGQAGVWRACEHSACRAR